MIYLDHLAVSNPDKVKRKPHFFHSERIITGLAKNKKHALILGQAVFTRKPQSALLGSIGNFNKKFGAVYLKRTKAGFSGFIIKPYKKNSYKNNKKNRKKNKSFHLGFSYFGQGMALGVFFILKRGAIKTKKYPSQSERVPKIAGLNRMVISASKITPTAKKIIP